MESDRKIMSKLTIMKNICKFMKWTGNYIRLILLKLRYGKSFSVNIFCKKPVYIGKKCSIRISCGGKIVLHNGVYLDNCCTLYADGGIIKIKKNCYFNTYCRIVAKKYIEIGSNSIFGSNVSVYDHDHDITNGVKYAITNYKISSVSIGDFVWCGTNVVITKGVQIEENCVVGANTVVTGNLASDRLYTGYPATFKKILLKN